MLALALPVVATYFGIMLMGAVDVAFVGRVSAEAIGAVGLGTSLFTWVMIFGIGLLAGLDYLVAFAQGARRPEEGHEALIQGLWACTLLSLPLTGLLFAASDHLDWLGINPQVASLARGYIRIVAPSLWPMLVFTACRQYLTAMSVAVPAMVILLAANALNALLNYTLVLGKLGAPRLEAQGSAIATLVSRLAMMAAMFGYLWDWDRRRDRLFSRVPLGLNRGVMARFLRLGLPSALQMTFEVGVFALSTTLAARLASQALAAHQVVLNLASLTFMVPMGISSATAVLVGQALGRGAPREAARTGWGGFALGAGFMACSGLTLFAFSGPLLSLFTTDPAVSVLASKVILIAALFQLSDGVQVVGAGALRGLGDTRSPLIANAIGHWLVGFPIGALLCFRFDWGIQGLWTGLSLGLTTVATILLWAYRVRAREKTGPG